MAEFCRISQHDRGLMAVGVISVMGVAMMVTEIVMMVMVGRMWIVVRAVLAIAMDVRMVTSAMAMIKRAHVEPKYDCL
jgi:hypothetical protein